MPFILSENIAKRNQTGPGEPVRKLLLGNEVSVCHAGRIARSLVLWRSQTSVTPWECGSSAGFSSGSWWDWSEGFGERDAKDALGVRRCMYKIIEKEGNFSMAGCRL